MTKKTLPLLFALAICSSHVAAADLIQNGGFEADGFETYAPAGWTLHEEGAIGGSIVTSAAQSPASGYGTAGAASGSFYALLDAFYPSQNALIQTFVAPELTKATLSFALFVNDQSVDGAVRISGAGLDYTTADLNRHVRVDILSANASPFATGKEVLRTFYLGGATGRSFGDLSNAYIGFSFDVTDLLASGGTYKLRFANVANDAALQLGVDNVSLNVTAVPEPESWALMLAGIGMVGAIARRRLA
ncbi:PEPxxWA-CTERM sorting domain-containing protein [Methyloversatilis discipulorum]|jgi:hypothetical protein